MNSTIKPSFKVVFVEKSTCRSRKQCTEPTNKRMDANIELKTLYPNSH